jgi:hypothetical protein
MKNTALSINRDEWKEISLIPEVQVLFDNLDFIDLARIVYGAKYIYSTSDYGGIIYTLVGTYADGIRTIILVREDDILKVMAQ